MESLEKRHNLFPWNIRAMQSKGDCMISEVRIQKAKKLLEKAGYFTDNLWHIDDVKSKNPEIPDDVCMNILRWAVTSEVIYDEIWQGIEYEIQQEGYEVKK